MDCSDHDSDGSHDLIGSFTTKASELMKASGGSPVSSVKVKLGSSFVSVCQWSLSCPLCNCLGGIRLHPPRETEEKEKLQKFWGCVSEEL